MQPVGQANHQSRSASPTCNSHPSFANLPLQMTQEKRIA
jgi:hypothetical protein